MAHTTPQLSGGRGDLGAIMTFTADGAGTVVSAPQENIGDTPARGIELGINITTLTGTTPTVTVTLQGIDKASGHAFTILASAALNATGFTTLTVFPGSAVAANVSANAELPEAWQVSVTIGGTTPAFTGTIGASLLY